MVKTVKTALKSVKEKKEENRAVGRRKMATARVRLDKGEGKIIVNGKELKQYFTLSEQEIVLVPLKILGKEKDLNISAKVNGGGKNGQAKAVQHGIARALVKWNIDFKKSLKVAGLLTRDPRIKERKKPGLKKARRAPQWSKR
ncbi:MAG TPA: 30S ribosomal protein S9 [Candidatus Magasanikbacteria bacterium]|nr:30S ribosomal protein S9 [Candidatus Magasanikbacteria bacterium]